MKATKETYTANKDITTHTMGGPETIKKGSPIPYDRETKNGLVFDHFYGYGQNRLFKWEDVNVNR